MKLRSFILLLTCNLTYSAAMAAAPAVNLNDTLVVVYGNNTTFYLINSDGSQIDHVNSAANKANWYRLATEDKYAKPVKVEIGMSSDAIKKMKKAGYSCQLTLTATGGTGPEHTATLAGLNYSDTNYPDFKFAKSTAGQYTPDDYTSELTLTLNTICKNNTTRGQVITFNPQILTLYVVKHF